MFEFDEKMFCHPRPDHGHFPPERKRYTMTEEMEHTTREMRECIARLFDFEKKLGEKVEDIIKNITSDNVIFKNTFSESHRIFLEAVKNEINTFEGNTDSAIALFMDEIKSDYATLSEDCAGQIQQYYNEFVDSLASYRAELNETYDTFRDAIESRLEQHNSNYIQAFTDYTTSINNKIAATERKLNQDYSAFTSAINNTVSDFKVTWSNQINARLDGQDSMIHDAVAYMKTNLNTNIETLLYQMKEDGSLIGIIETEVFVTPEMYGAVGDGIVDDTNAFIQAIASGKPVVGKADHIYNISSVAVTNTEITGCNFVSTDATDGLILKSGATIEKCGFSGFNHAIKATDANIVASSIRDCTFQYCKNGVYLVMQNSTSINKLVVDNNYFVKHGENPDNMDASPSDSNGFGLYLAGNICGAHISKNVFEYCTFAGIGIANDNSNYRLGVFIHDNYFEGNKHSAIYFNVANRTAHQISVTDNFYSVLDTNVFVTNGIYVNGAISSVYDIADDNQVICCSKFTDEINHKTVLNVDNCDSIYLQISPVKFGIEYLRVVYKATLNNDIQFKDVNGNALFSMTNGIHTEIIPYGSSFVLSRTPTDGESIEILCFGM